MSIVPPTPVILSKIKYYAKQRLCDDPTLLETVFNKFAPFFTFRLKANFRNAQTQDVSDVTDLKELTEEKDEIWDCIDKALFMHTRVKKKLRQRELNAGFYRVYLQCKRDDQNDWSDLYLDEFPVNIQGLSDNQPL